MTVASASRVSTRLFVAQALSGALSVPVTIMMARGLSADGLGEFQTLNRLMLVVVGFAVLGYPHAIAWAIACARSPEGYARVRKYLYAASAIGGLVVVCAFVSISVLMQPPNFVAFWVFMAYAIFNVVNANQINLLRGRLRPGRLFLTRMTQVVVWFVAVLVLWLLEKLTVESAAWTMLACQILAVLIGFAQIAADSHSVGESTGEQSVYSEVPTFARTSGFAAKVLPGLAVREWSVNADQLIVAILLTSADVGLYAVAASLALAIGLCTNPLSGTVQPIVQAAPVDDRSRVVAKYFAATFVVVLVPAGLLALAAPLLIPVLYGKEFGESVPLLLVLICAALANAFTATASGVLLGLGRPGSSSVAIFAGFAVSLTFWILLGYTLGLIGIALGTVLGALTSAVVQVALVSTQLRLSISSLLLRSIKSLPSVALLIGQTAVKEVKALAWNGEGKGRHRA
ncbi:polysaccharide biosynthesis C-terminal domain-containing protein [Gordonia sp. AC31]|uniref:lipopolysaccharide biosynthesis protein n=1 Tax=Gordonia sp. AC31 TaxID=2962571 RepID=UPI002880FDB2|nr:polysaccharide biosynthesis C-terminal domain-containing protein [Gordonia sp. AC31]MDT0223428.1 polysaccharide biosynthesis C-terminal domain-containing protein [Gordonia sp. AC31]